MNLFLKQQVQTKMIDQAVEKEMQKLKALKRRESSLKMSDHPKGLERKNT